MSEYGEPVEVFEALRAKKLSIEDALMAYLEFYHPGPAGRRIIAEVASQSREASQEARVSAVDIEAVWKRIGHAYGGEYSIAEVVGKVLKDTSETLENKLQYANSALFLVLRAMILALPEGERKGLTTNAPIDVASRVGQFIHR